MAASHNPTKPGVGRRARMGILLRFMAPPQPIPADCLVGCNPDRIDRGSSSIAPTRRASPRSCLVGDLGFEAIDAGPLRAARLLEPLAMLWIELALEHGQGHALACL